MRSAAVGLLAAAALESAPVEVGSAVCGGCHPAIAREYAATGMARSAGRATAIPEGGPEGRKIDYRIGSGAVGHSFAYAVDGFLFQTPVSYYASLRRWEVSPGFPNANEWSRPVEPGCLQCHASRLRSKAGTQNGYEDPAFLEGGVSCERCHGAGSEHVERMRKDPGAADRGLVNPARLAPVERDSVCAQCHLTGEVRIARRGRAPGSFRPGERLTEYTGAFVWADGASRGLKVTSHFEKLAQSACRKASGGKLWCGTCHAGHSFAAKPACLACHQTLRCRNGPDCVSCHMPKSPVVDVDHAVFTDHSIPRQPGGAVPARDPVRRLVPFFGGEAAPRELGLAYANVAARERSRALGLQAIELLRGIQDPAALAQLAGLEEREGRAAEAIRLYTRALEADPAQPAAATNLGVLHARQGRMVEAMRLWKDALSRNPGFEPARVNLAVAQIRAGEVRMAEENLRQVLEFNPAHIEARRMMEELRGRR